MFLLAVLHSSPWSVTLRQPKIQQFPFIIEKSNSFPLSKKAENALAFFTFGWLPVKKTKGQKSLQNSSLTQASFIIVHK